MDINIYIYINIYSGRDGVWDHAEVAPGRTRVIKSATLALAIMEPNKSNLTSRQTNQM